MDRTLYMQILEETLFPFVTAVYPDSHRLMDPKHTSKDALKFLEDNNIYWWRTPAESPDLNPIENLWHELKVCHVFSLSCLINNFYFIIGIYSS